VCHALGSLIPVVFNPAIHKVVSLRDSPDPLCLLPSHCPNAPNDPSSRMYSSGLTIQSGSDLLGSSLLFLLCLSRVRHMCTCLNLFSKFYTVKQTLCSGIPSSVELLLGTTVELFLTRQLVLMQRDSVYVDAQLTS